MVKDQVITDKYAIYNGDSCEVIKEIPDNSIHFSISSWPFASLYTYSNSERDMGNCRTYEEFSEHIGFLIKEQFRVHMPGRLLAIHCMNLPTSKQHHGYIGIQDFRGDIIRWMIGNEAAEMYTAINHLRKRANLAQQNDAKRAEILRLTAFNIEQDLKQHPGWNGFIYHSEVCIWKDPVTAMQRTKALGLLHKQIKKDSAMSRQGIPDYLVIFRKPGDNPEPVTHTNESFPVAMWQRYASPVWAIAGEDYGDGILNCYQDINPSDTLQRESARDHKDERHICPLQLSVIRRAIELWTNPGDVVADFFGGIGSSGVESVKMGRYALLCELKESYYRQSVLNCKAAEFSDMPLFGGTHAA